MYIKQKETGYEWVSESPLAHSLFDQTLVRFFWAPDLGLPSCLRPALSSFSKNPAMSVQREPSPWYLNKFFILDLWYPGPSPLISKNPTRSVYQKSPHPRGLLWIIFQHWSLIRSSATTLPSALTVWSGAHSFCPTATVWNKVLLTASGIVWIIFSLTVWDLRYLTFAVQ